jgi:hypothetical protein
VKSPARRVSVAEPYIGLIGTPSLCWPRPKTPRPPNLLKVPGRKSKLSLVTTAAQKNIKVMQRSP